MESERRTLHFFEVWYVPNLLEAKRYTIGLLAFERNEKTTVFADARFLPNPENLLSVDPSVDVDLLRAFFREAHQQLRHSESADAFLGTMLDSFSNTFQISDGKTILFSGEPNAEIDRFAAQVAPQLRRIST